MKTLNRINDYITETFEITNIIFNGLWDNMIEIFVPILLYPIIFIFILIFKERIIQHYEKEDHKNKKENN